MTDTGQIPGEGLPESAGMVEQPGVLAPGAYTYLNHSDTPAEDDDLLLMPGQQGAWGNEMPQPAPAPAPFLHEPGPHEMAGRDSGSIDVGAVRTPPPAPVPPSATPRRPLHLGPPTPDATLSPVRSLSDRGPADAPMRPSGPPTTGPEYLDVPQPGENSPQGAVPWGAPPQTQTVPPVGPEGTTAETVVPQPAPTPEPVAVEPAPAQVAPEAAPLAPEGYEPLQGQAIPAGPQALETPGAPVGAEPPQTPAPGAPQDAQAPVPGAQDVQAEPTAAPQAPDAAPVAAPQAPGAASAAAPQAAPDAADAVSVPEGVSAAESAHGPHGAPAPAAPQIPDAAPAPAGPSAEAAPAPVTPQAPQAVPAPDAVSDAQVSAPQTPVAHAPDAQVSAPQTPVAHAPDAQVPAAQAPDAQVPAAPHAPQPADDAAQTVVVVPDAGVPQQADAPAPASTGLPEAPAQEPEADDQAAPVQDAQDPASEHAQDPAQAVTPVPDEQAPESRPADQAVHIADTEARIPDAETPFEEPALPLAAEEAQPAAAESVQAVPVGVAAQAAAPEASAGQVHGEQPAADEPGAPQEPEPDQTLGQFVPVEGTVPTTPHLAPTPPHALIVPPLPPQEQQPAEEPAAAAAEQEEPVAAAPTAEEPAVTVPAPRDGEAPAPEPSVVDQEPVVAQQAEDLDTRAADQEESTAAVEEARESTGPAAPGYDDAEREAVLRVMRERRDIRNGFRSDPIPHDVLLRVLEAAHTAPSVGHSQPWDFVVIRSAETRRTMHELAQRQREAYAKSLPKGRAKQFKELKIEAILDTPVNIVVTADPTRGGRHTLGRHTQPQMAPYSSALAVENLWLAARAEGLGVGWVSFFDEREMVRTLGLPEHLEVVAYLCVGYVDEFPDEPELMQAGWSKRRPLSWVVHEETYGRRALPGEEPHDLLAETVAGIRPLDAKALGEAWERQKRMTKPAGALGMLEIISAQLSGLSRQCPPPIPEPAAVAIFAGDHGVHAQGVTPWPQEVTAQMVANFLGGGAVCNAFAGQVGAEVCVVDVGVAADLPATPGLLPRKVRAGTADMTTGPALTREEVKQAIEVGIETARDLVAAGNKALLTGEMGIANTTASAALISVFTDTDPSEVTGRGTGINDETLARKTEVVRRAIELHQPDPADPIGVLAAFGGLEHAAMVGLLLGGASLRTPVILDGVSAGAAALVARAIAPEVLAACIAGHRSAEPGHVAALNKLGLRPLVDLDLRLGEGTGALLALPLVQSAARAMHEVATFDSAGVTEK
ncbi:nicotinate-nucleotide--dimethylbenzimidazole phosphoribosyltransferase [Streptomyces yaanensis]|uniref:Nicotinate-nucleotide--dimethylbenzimidazole phosphoribosyltransferase n=1 Tax=Streptomyces yaanensis TaxID=1142239 RepID=A0ABV7SLA7_9ACTN|nr:nicotinate-nucleotide--dimethylbenzimidazole phosphoribosyltransferase [Streptomyces sp. CGMCC 4.7035]WNC00723.1 nicotinate-nucleotide--dimethylbenzimidazole phosphoribosyltransferase [Streptomyces sp. CGMCC 4.7035]